MKITTWLLFLIPLSYCINSFAEHGLEPIPSDFKVVQGSELLIENMPKVRNQGAVGICYAFTAATLFDEAYCQDKKIADCANAPDSLKSSPLDMTRFNQQLDKDQDDRDRFPYEGLSVNGGYTANTLARAIRTRAIATESCAPFGQVQAKVSDTFQAQEIELAYWKRFKNIYETHKQKKDICAKCAKEYAKSSINDLRNQLNLQAADIDLMEAFKQDTYEKFLDRLLIPEDCWDDKNLIGLKGGWSVKFYPQEQDKEKSYNSYINKIKELLKKKRPLSISFCTQEPLIAKSPLECSTLLENGIKSSTAHEVIIKGYRKVCNSKNICRESLQVQNSLGQSWQDNNNDGWVAAKELLDRTFYQDGFTWLERK